MESVVFKATEHVHFNNYCSPLNEKNITNIWSFYYKTPKGNIIFPYKQPQPNNNVIIGGRTKLEAETLKKKCYEPKYDMYIVRKNADFTEGRGPMNIHAAFKTYDEAVSYIMEQKGIYGSAQYSKTNIGINFHNEIYASVYFNGYDIYPMNFK